MRTVAPRATDNDVALPRDGRMTNNWRWGAGGGGGVGSV